MTAARRRRLEALRPALDGLYARYNRRAFVDPDPLAPVYAFADPAEQEVAALLAATLAFGNVKTILESIRRVFEAVPAPARAARDLPPATLRRRLEGFRHRYVTGDEVAALLAGAGSLLREYGSLGGALMALDDPESATVLPGIARLADALRARGGLPKNYLVPDPALGSACKRWFMLLRWMVREDEVDLGLWRRLGAGRLIVPVDTHMHRVAIGLGLTRRKAADLKAALEITAAFRAICPEDPVRYDFCLTRLGIRADGDMAAFVREARKPGA
jgi:uncharacterized protein (TIGR02757 family)